MTLFSHRAASFDLHVLLELFDNDRAALVSLLEAAIASIRSAAQAVQDGTDPEAIVDAAHRLKGTGGTLGARRLIEICAHLETAAGQTPGSVPPALLADLITAVESIEADIGSYVGGPN